MLNRSASLAMSTSVLKALPGKLDIKRHSPSILYIPESQEISPFPTGDLQATRNRCHSMAKTGHVPLRGTVFDQNAKIQTDLRVLSDGQQGLNVTLLSCSFSLFMKNVN